MKIHKMLDLFDFDLSCLPQSAFERMCLVPYTCSSIDERSFGVADPCM